MIRLITFLFAAAFTLSACEEPAPPRMGSDGKPLPRLYRISNTDESKIQYRVLDSINSLRQAAGAGSLVLNAKLAAAAETHARDMSRQNRAWHFGSDGSSPLDRVARTGYDKAMLGENLSETYETELETLAAWMEQPDTRAVILDKRATDLGFAWHQDSNGKIWWALLTGG
jgi:uncharacterized protein YkwD